ncbi:MAG: hypothetical protein IJT08_00780 [Alphaproteobacteria bacterium]|nr:hypothetical protein [Alphaproteobacteria bacterium]
MELSVIDFLLLLSNDRLIMLIAVLFFVFSRDDGRRNYAPLVFLLLFAMVYKTVLKDVFRLPAPIASPTKNFGFPSGHMNFATMFYLWFVVNAKGYISRTLLVLSLIFAGVGLYLSGYHDAFSILVTPIFPITCLFLYRRFLLDRNMEFQSLFFLTISTCTIFITSLVSGTPKIDLVIGAYGTLGFYAGNTITTGKYTRLLLASASLLLFFITSQSQSTFLGNCCWTTVFAIPPILRSLLHQLRRA